MIGYRAHTTMRRSLGRGAEGYELFTYLPSSLRIPSFAAAILPRALTPRSQAISTCRASRVWPRGLRLSRIVAS